MSDHTRRIDLISYPSRRGSAAPQDERVWSPQDERI